MSDRATGALREWIDSLDLIVPRDRENAVNDTGYLQTVTDLATIKRVNFGVHPIDLL